MTTVTFTVPTLAPPPICSRSRYSHPIRRRRSVTRGYHVYQAGSGSRLMNVSSIRWRYRQVSLCHSVCHCRFILINIHSDIIRRRRLTMPSTSSSSSPSLRTQSKPLLTPVTTPVPTCPKLGPVVVRVGGAEVTPAAAACRCSRLQQVAAGCRAPRADTAAVRQASARPTHSTAGEPRRRIELIRAGASRARARPLHFYRELYNIQ